MSLGRPSPDGAGGDFAAAVVWLLRTQALLVVVTSSIALVYAGSKYALAAILGGGIGILLTAVAALRAGTTPAHPGMMMAAFYRGMALKLGLAVVLFVAVAVWFGEWFLPVLVGYMSTLIAYWLALLRIGRGATRSQKTH